MKWAVLAALAVVTLIAAIFLAAWAELSGASAERRSFADLKSLVGQNLKVYRPDGAGPFPVVLMFHGCGGVREVQDDYAKIAQGAGVMAIVVDSMTPRGISYEKAVETVCSGRKLRGAERSGDVYAALALARDLPDVDANRMSLIGWSHGGWSIMDALVFDPPRERPHGLRDAPRDPFAGVVGISLIYPYAGFPALTAQRGWSTTSVPVDALVLTDDTTAKYPATMAAIERARASGAQVDVEEWSGITHAFDERDLSADSQYEHDPEATDRVHARFAAWLQRVVIGADA